MRHKLTCFGTVTVASAGTRVQVTSEPIETACVWIEADTDNTGLTFVGDESVDSTNGSQLNAEEGLEWDGKLLRGDGTKFLLSDIWVDAATNGNKVRVFYLRERA